eukprot:TRINITY_DN1189_c0_g2_i5.p1 TRINITY_DN1189_c0_g2~~TRINITY_DN1189_c0_g2_i5.p1  ORF type:complete len:200 (+),score=23.79 TRINITY_DN1189_c0_g2_i5:493-1092(+)
MVQVGKSLTMVPVIRTVLTFRSMVIVRRCTNSRIKDYEFWIHVFAWGIPTILTIVPLSRLKFENRIFWCWITPTDSGIWEFGAYYVPLSLALLVTTFCWILVVLKLLRVKSVSSQLRNGAHIIQSSVGLSLFIITLSLQFTHRLVNIYLIDSYSLEMIHTILFSSVGIYVFLIFGLTYDNFVSYSDLFCGGGDSESSFE